MTPDEIRQIVREEIGKQFDRIIFNQHIQILNARNIQLGRTNGTKIGTAADQKLGFFGKTPVVQQGAITIGATEGVLGYDNNLRSAVNSIITELKNLGLTA